MNYHKFNRLAEIIREENVDISYIRRMIGSEPDYWGAVTLKNMEMAFKIANSGDYIHHCPECYRALPKLTPKEQGKNHYQLQTLCSCGAIYYE